MGIKKVVFLDIDGVLNTGKSADGRYAEWEKVKILSTLIKRSRAAVILHSGWRFWMTEEMVPLNREAEGLLDLLNMAGLVLSGKTPDFSTEEIRKSKKFSLVKGTEIRQWLLEHPETTHYVVLDDLLLKDEIIRSHQVLVDGNKGLTERDVEEALRILC